MAKITITRWTGVPIEKNGKIYLTEKIKDNTYEEEMDTTGMDIISARQDFINRKAREVANYNVEQENLAKRDKMKPKRRIYQLIISNIT